ncbi:MAG: hypothetical protein PUE12_05540 [Oscillospiraceae bacterium]|nr:hypothetical protein [Oscillospiraceae bacterium]
MEKLFSHPLFWCIIILSVVIVLCIILTGKRKRRKPDTNDSDTSVKPADSIEKTVPEIRKTEKELSMFRVKWFNERVTNEYCTANNKIKDNLTDDDYKQIDKFACVPISYLFAWLVKHNYCSGYFSCKYNLEWIKTENSDPAEFISEELDGIINYSALSDDIREFIDYYYTPADRFLSGSGHKSYQNDYYSVIRNPWKVFFNIDFSWDFYHKLEEKIDRQYKYFMIEKEWAESDIYDENRIAGQIYSDRLGKYFDLYVAEGVRDDYVLLCTNQIKNMSDEMYNHFCDRIYAEFIMQSGGLRADYISREMIIEGLNSCSIMIPPSYGRKAAYILGFEADFEREHGVSVTVRGDYIIDVSYRMEATSPWDSKNKYNYKMECALANLETESIDTVGKALLEYSKGNLEQTVIVPSFVQMPVPEENRLFVPAPAFERKTQIDIISEKMLSEGSADRYECKPGYKEESVVPSFIQIRLYKSGNVVFAERVNIW